MTECARRTNATCCLRDQNKDLTGGRGWPTRGMITLALCIAAQLASVAGSGRPPGAAYATTIEPGPAGTVPSVALVQDADRLGDDSIVISKYGLLLVYHVPTNKTVLARVDAHSPHAADLVVGDELVGLEVGGGHGARVPRRAKRKGRGKKTTHLVAVEPERGRDSVREALHVIGGPDGSTGPVRWHFKSVGTVVSRPDHIHAQGGMHTRSSSLRPPPSRPPSLSPGRRWRVRLSVRLCARDSVRDGQGPQPAASRLADRELQRALRDRPAGDDHDGRVRGRVQGATCATK